MRKRFTAVCAAICALFAGCRGTGSTGEFEPVSGFEVEKYMGQWYEIARIPHWFEKELNNVTAFYKLERDGLVLVENRGFKPNGSVKVAKGYAYQPENGIGILKVSFFRPFYGEYKIIYLEEDYSAAIVTSSTKDYLWILSRTPEMSEVQKQRYLEFLRLRGFPLEKLQWMHWQKQP